MAADDSWQPEQWPQLSAFADEVRHQLVFGNGFVRIRGLADLALDVDQMQRAYARIGTAIGAPLLNYGLLYPVTDRGADHTKAAIPVSMTGAETCFHTDSSALRVVPDFVGLLCEQPSEHGGDSLVSNAILACQRLQKESPELLAELLVPLVRDIVTPGLEKTRANLLRNRFPVIAPCSRPGGVLVRYMRYWIEAGHKRAGVPIDASQRQAFDRFDSLLKHKDHVVRFRLERGDMVWINNRRVAHNRTAFEDTPGNVRSLQRMWLEMRAEDAAGCHDRNTP
ncbi:MAG: TauD/TfdA family dioxygenase [Planctomycetota bacterium]